MRIAAGKIRHLYNIQGYHQALDKFSKLIYLIQILYNKKKLFQVGWSSQGISTKILENLSGKMQKKSHPRKSIQAILLEQLMLPAIVV